MLFKFILTDHAWRLRVFGGNPISDGTEWHFDFSLVISLQHSGTCYLPSDCITGRNERIISNCSSFEAKESAILFGSICFWHLLMYNNVNIFKILTKMKCSCPWLLCSLQHKINLNLPFKSIFIFPTTFINDYFGLVALGKKICESSSSLLKLKSFPKTVFWNDI